MPGAVWVREKTAIYHPEMAARQRSRQGEKKMNRGYIKLYRKITGNELWTAEPFDKCRAWIDLLLIANYKPGAIRKRGILVKLSVGSVGWSQVALAERWKWSRGKVIRFLNELEKEQMIIQQKSPVTTLIHITNYEQYQGDRATNGTTNGQQTVQEEEGKEGKEKNITDLLNRYSAETKKIILSELFPAFASIRKSNRVADSILIKELEYYSRFPVDRVEQSIRKYLDRQFHQQGKDEKYLRGILRRQQPESTTIQNTTGSSLLDSVYATDIN